MLLYDFAGFRHDFAIAPWSNANSTGRAFSVLTRISI
jgi:hypothetical protein